jgi:RNA polymerase sigma-70 factor (ECF subfamily)
MQPMTLLGTSDEPSRGAEGGNGQGPAAIDWQAELAAHGPWLRWVIAARTGDRQAVDDVWQEVAVAAVEQRAPIADATRVAPWLYRLAVIQALRYRRRMGRRRRRESAFAEARPMDGGCDEIPIEWLLRKERREMVREALGRLAGKDAEILMLKYYEGWSCRRISDQLGISEKAADARLHRARQRLRAELAAFVSDE